MNWQPIKTAPEMQPVIICQSYQPRSEIGIRFLMKWYVWRVKYMHAPEVHVGESLTEDEAPTHWMPLPDPPNTPA